MKNFKFKVLEDNDPSGYKSSKGKLAKKEAGLISVDLPPRSPDLNPLDYSVWHAINVAMRRQETKMRKTTYESKAAYLNRLRQTALSLPRSTMQNAIKDMYKRVRSVSQNRGGLFIE